jgi:hypothetical protein
MDEFNTDTHDKGLSNIISLKAAEIRHKIKEFDLVYQDHMRRLTKLREHIDVLKNMAATDVRTYQDSDS